MLSATFRTPRGHPVTMEYRADTSDWNTLSSCLTEDEYRLRNLTLTGKALDIGAHIGGVTVALATDNPELEVTAVEPVPDNVALLRANVERNGLAERVTIIDGPAGRGGMVSVNYGYSGSETACHHAFIGNTLLIGGDAPHTTRRMRSLAFRKDIAGFAFVKIDCEGCEWEVDLRRAPLIRGEWHPTAGHTREEFAALLSATHELTFSGPLGGPGGFEAVRRG